MMNESLFLLFTIYPFELFCALQFDFQHFVFRRFSNSESSSLIRPPPSPLVSYRRNSFCEPVAGDNYSGYSSLRRSYTGETSPHTTHRANSLSRNGSASNYNRYSSVIDDNDYVSSLRRRNSKVSSPKHLPNDDINF